MIDRNGGDLWSSMQRDLKLQMWVYFNVKICIDLFFKSFCKTVFHVQSSTDVLFDDKSTPTFIGKVADSSGQVNLGVVETYARAVGTVDIFCAHRLVWCICPVMRPVIFSLHAVEGTLCQPQLPDSTGVWGFPQQALTTIL